MALPLLARFSFSARLGGIGTGTCVTFLWLRPLRDDGIINRGSGRSACGIHVFFTRKGTAGNITFLSR